MEEIFSKIDELLSLLKEKGDFDKYKYIDRRAILILTLVRLELAYKKELSDATYSAIRSVVSCSYQDYMGTSGKIHECLISFGDLLHEYNHNPHKADIDYPACHYDDKTWLPLIDKIIKGLIVEETSLFR